LDDETNNDVGDVCCHETNNDVSNVCCHYSPNVHDYMVMVFDASVGQTPIKQEKSPPTMDWKWKISFERQ